MLFEKKLSLANFSSIKYTYRPILILFPVYTFISLYMFIKFQEFFHHTCLYAPTRLLETGEYLMWQKNIILRNYQIVTFIFNFFSSYGDRCYQFAI